MFIVVVICGIVFFFFKQKTAYEMRISDWSSDVCSSDLPALEQDGVAGGLDLRRGRVHPSQAGERQRRQAEGDQGADALAARQAIGGEFLADFGEIGRASCRERVCSYV